MLLHPFLPKGCTVRDVTARYASNWCTYGHKQRLGDEWWEESLRPFEPTSQDEREAEEEDILCKCSLSLSLFLSPSLSSCYVSSLCTAMLYAQPLPTSINDYKNHPLWVSGFMSSILTCIYYVHRWMLECCYICLNVYCVYICNGTNVKCVSLYIVHTQVCPSKTPA